MKTSITSSLRILTIVACAPCSVALSACSTSAASGPAPLDARTDSPAGGSDGSAGAGGNGSGGVRGEGGVSTSIGPGGAIGTGGRLATGGSQAMGGTVVFDAGSSSGGNVGMGGVQGSGGTHGTGGTTGTGGFDDHDAGVEVPLRPDAATAQIDSQDADAACGGSGDAPCAGTLACPQTLAQECAAVDPPPATSGPYCRATLADAENLPQFCRSRAASVGPCGAYTVVRNIFADSGYFYYYDPSGALVAVTQVGNSGERCLGGPPTFGPSAFTTPACASAVTLPECVPDGSSDSSG